MYFLPNTWGRRGLSASGQQDWPADYRPVDLPFQAFLVFCVLLPRPTHALTFQERSPSGAL